MNLSLNINGPDIEALIVNFKKLWSWGPESQLTCFTIHLKQRLINAYISATDSSDSIRDQIYAKTWHSLCFLPRTLTLLQFAQWILLWNSIYFLSTYFKSIFLATVYSRKQETVYIKSFVDWEWIHLYTTCKILMCFMKWNQIFTYHFIPFISSSYRFVIVTGFIL